MAFTSRNDEDVMSEMNITPLVDVMLVLLVVFIVTAPMLTNAIPIQLPKTSAVAPADRTDPVVISIDGEQRVFINKENLAREQLVPRLQQAKASNADLVVQVQADKEANYGEVAALLADVEQAGITRLSLLTQK
ncbi:ExbD/TolR family protein [Pectobacterium odoriferum]|uniref:Biopolymer transporter ExbD n=1 Tax=Pectobacterium odoriferum TaxID=78398 RepID=A0ABD6VLZ1_9GAMM|nr:biopolymer transporter ExbD [Pectobacterium odoriferum]AIU90188.1 biopolymer transporter ExbD [Pectobacterium odoriferum]KGA36652.1 biopolymer transporter ExbD [Pectobacterium odoriferum]KGA42399.1 biopolymer transporter ExbD [Pectobacterium odoriferum]MBA0186626.1 biopolymer transporter ExbD [Pectobacterium odoriferum]MCA6963055.1 biopolymer transporter ExbD [Pectobacterium odoriferum]